jgi:hypothetical protein
MRAWTASADTAAREVSPTTQDGRPAPLPPPGNEAIKCSMILFISTDMSSQYPLDVIPPWVLFLLMALVTLLAIEAGLWMGARRRRTAEHEQEGPVGAVVGATLGLLGFMLAITCGVAANRFDVRKQLLLDDVNAIGTTYLRAGLLLEPHRTRTRNLLRDYVNIRARIPELKGPDELQGAIARSEALQEQLWSHAAAIAEADRSSEIDALFISSLNEMFDLHTKRVVIGTQYRLPPVLWGVLIFVLVISMVVVGFQFGLAGRRSLHANVAVALTFSAVLLLIHDLDRSRSGWFIVSHGPMIELQRKLNSPSSEARDRTIDPAGTPEGAGPR